MSNRVGLHLQYHALNERFPYQRMEVVVTGSDILGVVGLLVGLIGVAMAYVSHRRSVQASDLRYVVDMTRVLTFDGWLITNGLKVIFNDEREIDGVCRSYVALWNHRGDVVRGTEILESDPLRIELDPSDSILQMRLVNRTRQQLMVGAIRDPHMMHRATLNFDHLAAGDGCVFENVHHEPVEPRLQGTVRGKPLRQQPSMSLDDAERQALRSGWKKRWKAYSVWNYYFPVLSALTAVVTLALVLSPAFSIWVLDFVLSVYSSMGIYSPTSS